MLIGFQSIIGPVLAGAGLVLLHADHSQHSGKLGTLAIFLSLLGLAFVAALPYIPYFHELRVTDVSTLSVSRAGWYVSGICLFFSLMAALILGLIVLGVSSLRAKVHPQAMGAILIVAGLVSFIPEALGLVLVAVAVIWLISIQRRTSSTRSSA